MPVFVTNYIYTRIWSNKPWRHCICKWQRFFKWGPKTSLKDLCNPGRISDKGNSKTETLSCMWLAGDKWVGERRWLSSVKASSHKCASWSRPWRDLGIYNFGNNELDLVGNEADSCHEGWTEEMVFMFVIHLYIFYTLNYLKLPF